MRRFCIENGLINRLGLGWFSLLFQVGCLIVSNDVLGLAGPVADNISGNVIGMGLATAFRFWTFRRYVFQDH